MQIDGLWRVASLSDAPGRTSHFDYDTAGRRTSVTDALGQVSAYSYDSAGQLTQVSQWPEGGLGGPSKRPK